MRKLLLRKLEKIAIWTGRMLILSALAILGYMVFTKWMIEALVIVFGTIGTVCVALALDDFLERHSSW